MVIFIASIFCLCCSAVALAWAIYLTRSLKWIWTNWRSAMKANAELGEALVERLSSREDAQVIVDTINRLREDEGDSVEIFNDNPDDGPNTIIAVRWGFSDEEAQFTGNDLRDCLMKAMEARYKRKKA